MYPCPPPPIGPRQPSRVRRLRNSENALRMLPPGSGQKPPPSVTRHDCCPLSPAASAPVVCRCRNLAAFKTHPPPFGRGAISAPMPTRKPESGRNAGIHAQARNRSGNEPAGSRTRALMQSPKVIAPPEMGLIVSRGQRLSSMFCTCLPGLACQRRGLLMVWFSPCADVVARVRTVFA